MNAMSALELQKFIGKEATFEANGFVFDVRIIDARSDGRDLQFLITPIAGKGQSWVASSAVQQNPD